ncbi:MAG: Uma2 family endonuclease [Blastocatellia bacterium]
MSQAVSDLMPDIRGLITEDDAPVDNFLSEKQQRLLTEPLYSSWGGPGDGRNFLAAANVGIFYIARNPAIVPDVFLSLDVDLSPEWLEREQRSYFLWEFGKPPEAVIEIVSNREGDEDREKKRKYARLRVEYYVISDPLGKVMAEPLTVYQLHDFDYRKIEAPVFPALGLGLSLWEGDFEGHCDTWLRWTDAHGQLILTGRERAKLERNRADEAERALREAREQLARMDSELRERALDSRPSEE